MYEISQKDLTRGKKIAIGAIGFPLLLTGIPAIVTILLMVFAAVTPPAAAVILFAGVISTLIGFIFGLVIAGILVRRRSMWSVEMRDRIAADGIRAEEIGWFRKEIKPAERKALRSVESRDVLLGDVYRETLASRLTATRVIKSSKRELLLAKRRQSSVQRLKSAQAAEFGKQIESDIEKLVQINDEAKLMLAEAETRLQMVEAAATRQGSLAQSELALKKLTARTSELPLALESAKMAEEIRLELENQDLNKQN